VRQYFAEIAEKSGVTLREAAKAPKAKWHMVTILWFAFVVCFIHWIRGHWLGLALLPFSGALATFHTFHDASHGALSSRAWVNEVFTFCGFLIASPHEWRWQHILGHHAFTNIRGLDPDSKHTARWLDAEEHARPPRFLVPFIWGLAVPVGLHGLAAWRLVAANLWPNSASNAFSPPPRLEVASLVASVVHRCIFYLLPLLRFGWLWGAIWVIYPAVVFSWLFMLNTQLAHLNDQTHGESSSGRSDCWYRHQVATTADFAPRSVVHWIVSGGLNLQVEHHLFPTVDHWHLPALRHIVEKVCAQHGIPLHTFDGYVEGCASHMHHLSSGRLEASGESPANRTHAQAEATHAHRTGSAAAPSCGDSRDESSKVLEPRSSFPSGAVDTDVAEDPSLCGQAQRPRVCIVGSGIAGNGAAYLLRQGYDVTLCESQARVGGHAYTMTGPGHKADVGFQVFNFSNYPLLSRLFDELGVDSVQSDMSLSVGARNMQNQQDYEWSSRSLFPTWSSVFVPSIWLRLFEILRFERLARQALADSSGSQLGDITLEEWLRRVGLSDKLRDEYVVPMSSALWSCPTQQVLEFPAITILGFLENHFMLQRQRPKWRTPKHRSQDYVEKLHGALRRSGASIRASIEVSRLESDKSGRFHVVDVIGRFVDPEPFDKVVLAVHADQAAAILGRSSLSNHDLARVEDLLGNFKYFPNVCCLHKDPRIMPKNRACWSAWNVLQVSTGVVVTYWINKLQPGASEDGEDVFLSLNPPDGAVDAACVLKTFSLDHPVLDAAALRAQKGLPELQGLGDGRIFLCGAWAGHGFHEDGLRSALHACAALGADVASWQAQRIPLVSFSPLGAMLWKYLLVPALHSFIRRGSLRIVFGNGQEAVFGDGSGVSIEIRVLSESFLWRLLLDPGVGLADAYEDGAINVRPDLSDLFHLLLSNKGEKSVASPTAWMPERLITPLAKRCYAVLHSRLVKSMTGSTKNATDRYDLSNAMFGMFLSRDMTYSAGVFDKEVEDLQRQGLVEGSPDFLEVAQRKKLDRMLDLANLEEGDRVLEIGCGWGSMAIRAVERCPGIKSWTAITSSEEQRKRAEEHITACGLADRIQIVICDYKNAVTAFGAGSFTKVISCETIEAVGHEYLPQYFAAIDECLKPGGKVAIQATCVPDCQYESYRRGSDFIRERIYPGSNFVSLEEIKRAYGKGNTSLKPVAPPFSLGLSYAKTLHEWRSRFSQHEAAVRSEVTSPGEGFEERFLRRWHYYFAYCEVGFKLRHIDDWQICLQKAPESAISSGT